MTGGEIVAAGLSAGKAALSEDASTKKQLLKLAEGTPEMKAAAKALAQRVMVRQQILTKLTVSLARVLGVSTYFEEDFAEEFGHRMKNVTAEDIVDPDVRVSFPALQGLAMSLQDSSLKDMYLNLLATASDRNRAETAHPSFATIIGQLSPEEAALYAAYTKFKRSTDDSVGIARLALVSRHPFSSQANTLISHLVDWDSVGLMPTDEGSGHVYIENWRRLGLIEINYDGASQQSYTWVKKSALYRKAKTRTTVMTRVRIQHGYIAITALGSAFSDAVISDSDGESRDTDSSQEGDEGLSSGEN